MNRPTNIWLHSHTRPTQIKNKCVRYICMHWWCFLTLIHPRLARYKMNMNKLDEKTDSKQLEPKLNSHQVVLFFPHFPHKNSFMNICIILSNFVPLTLFPSYTISWNCVIFVIPHLSYGKDYIHLCTTITSINHWHKKKGLKMKRKVLLHNLIQYLVLCQPFNMETTVFT